MTRLPESPPPTANSRDCGDKAIAFVGPSGSGKTELICRLLEWFQAQGYRVAVLKHTHKLNLGDEGKDTWRYRQAGARIVALTAPRLLQITQHYPEDPQLAQVLALLAPEADLILVEGYKHGPLPKVALMGAEPENHLPDYPGIIALVSPEPEPEPLTSNLPVFRRQQVAELGMFLKKYLGWS